MLAEGRRRGGKPGTGLGPRSVQLTIGRLSAAFVQAISGQQNEQQPVPVRLPSVEHREDATWSEDQLRAFLAFAAADRLAACWLLSALGLRRAELLGLKWNAVDLDAGTLTIGRSHSVQVNRGSYLPRPKDLSAVSDRIGRLFAATAS